MKRLCLTTEQVKTLQDGEVLVLLPIKPQPKHRIEAVKAEWAEDYPLTVGHDFVIDRGYWANGKLLNRLIDYPYPVGSEVWIGEAWAKIGEYCLYKADGITDNLWRSPATMPKWASRHTGIVKEAGVQQVQDINSNDIHNMGFRRKKIPFLDDSYGYKLRDGGYNPNSKIAFAEDWNSRNPKYPWESNPWVWKLLIGAQ